MEAKTITITPVIKNKTLYFGKLPIACFYFDGLRPQGDPLSYKVVGLIKTIKQDLGHYATEDECEAVLGKVAEVVLKQLST